ncbi:polysaccharide deacetylase family protein [Mucilaginibacter glaciei]|uniref:Polysaccharide deacetylase family protein n=1 Tax=Mucilaginibacter glaciei TaxID=2772109 RepID=A0A926NV50_9SPHI|nr:polysaccharide deacetylase family protein [Mucilaginibacter glaciei]MBD1395270.1 polysaccharide deacetylase family protein [Mucilaginibacter glaciei]
MILLSFDIEEFDLPLEYGKQLPFAEQLSISTEGTLAVLDLLQRTGIKGTFFITANYAINQPDVIARIVSEGHEVASHGYYHSAFENKHLLQSKLALEQLTGKTVKGFRMARMMPVDNAAVKQAGYLYNSSINPTFIPGRYNNLNISRTFYREGGIMQLPSSVSPRLRFPLFWLSFHNLPMWIINALSYCTHKKDGYINIYFHPWEFTDLHQADRFGIPGYIAKNSGRPFIERIEGFIRKAKKRGLTFGTIEEYFAEELKKG